MIDHPLILNGQVVRLEPLLEEHIEPLMAIARTTPKTFKFTSTPVTDEQRDRYFEQAFRQRDLQEAYPFVLKLQGSNQIVGSSRFADINWQHRNCELGYTWIDKRFHGGSVNVESKYLMLSHAFEELGFVRVQIHTDTRNIRSQKAIERLGAVYEGILRCHMITKGGYIRDSMVFSITYPDWPNVKTLLQHRLENKLALQKRQP